MMSEGAWGRLWLKDGRGWVRYEDGQVEAVRVDNTDPYNPYRDLVRDRREEPPPDDGWSPMIRIRRSNSSSAVMALPLQLPLQKGWEAGRLHGGWVWWLRKSVHPQWSLELRHEDGLLVAWTRPPWADRETRKDPQWEGVDWDVVDLIGAVERLGGGL